MSNKSKNLFLINKQADLLLLLLYCAVAAAVLFRISIERTGYLSPDSKAYLGLAQNLLNGQGFYVLDEAGNTRHYFSTWPVGYPVLIFILAKLSGLSVFWASKTLNLALLAGNFLLLRKVCRPYAFVLASVFGAYTFIEVYSFTWSEAPFLLGVLLLAYTTSKALQQPNITSYTLYIGFVCLWLFLLRYIGAFALAVPAFLGLYFFYRGNFKAGVCYTIVTFSVAILAGAYLYNNYRLSGYITGFNRLQAPTESTADFLRMLAQGVGNELLLIRKYRSASQPDTLFYATTFIQIAVLIYTFISLKKAKSKSSVLNEKLFAYSCFAIAGLYLTAILVLRYISYFDALDYRLLSPFSFLVLVGLVHILVTLPESTFVVKRAKLAVFTFFLLSLLLNLPKEYILEQLR